MSVLRRLKGESLFSRALLKYSKLKSNSNKINEFLPFFRLFWTFQVRILTKTAKVRPDNNSSSRDKRNSQITARGRILNVYGIAKRDVFYR